MSVEVVQYEPEHAYDILSHMREEEVNLSKHIDWDKWVNAWKQNGPAYTLIINGKIVACAGVVLMEWKKGQAWVLLSSLFYQYKKTTYKLIKRFLELIIKTKDLKRVEAFVRPDFEEAINFIKHLGFNFQGLQECYGPNGEDYLMFARIKR